MRRDPDRAVLVRRPLQDRLLETLRYLAEEIDPRQAGSLGEAQAAGYIAGRLQRAEQQATVISFTADLGHTSVIMLLVAVAAVAGGIVAALPPAGPLRGVGWLVPATSLLIGALLWGEIEGSGYVGRWMGRGRSQSVVGVRAATGNRRSRLRVVLMAPLDRAPRFPPRHMLLLTLQMLAFETVVTAGFLATQRPALRFLGAAGGLVLAGIAVALALWRRRHDLQPSSRGTGELAVLIAVAEELAELQQVELWTVGMGAGSAGDAGIDDLLERYPFGADTCFINLHDMAAGHPVFVTREGLLREVRADRRLLALANMADAADVSINAEPRHIRRRTLAAVAHKHGYRALTITTHTDTSGFASPDPRTLERCVKLVVGMIRELDQEEAA